MGGFFLSFFSIVTNYPIKFCLAGEFLFIYICQSVYKTSKNPI
jgi:hypothetical protein